MMRFLTLENYRGFAKYRLENLARVNLLVGKNNCGKTSVLEAVQILGAEGNPRVMGAVARRRGEVVLTEDDSDDVRRLNPQPDASHFFHGHKLSPDASFALRSDDGIGAVLATITEPSEQRQVELFRYMRSSSRRAPLWLDIVAGDTLIPGVAPQPRGCMVSVDGAMWLDSRYSPQPDFEPERRTRPYLQYVGPESLDADSMRKMWDQVILDAGEKDVVQAVRIIAPGLSGLFFLSGKVRTRYAGAAGIVAAFEGEKQRVPLGSYGDGMRRLLALSLSLAQAKDGLLLVDEIDTGLHYSIMGDMWHMLVRTAKVSNVSVFATTHSLDCVRGLSWLCENHPDLAEQVSIQKIDNTIEQAVALDAEGIVRTEQLGIEVR